MKIAFVLAVAMASVQAQKAGRSYRNRHLTTYQEVCFPTASPVATPTPLSTSSPTTGIITAPPLPAPTKAPIRGKGGTVVSGPTSKSAPVCPPTSSKNSGKGGSTSSGSTPKSPPSPTSRTRPNHPNGPHPNGPRPSRSGPSPSKSGPSPSKSGPAPGCSRLLKMAATSLGLGSMFEEPTSQIQQSQPIATAQDIIHERALTIISLNTTLRAFGSYSLPASFSSHVVLTWPNYCFDATISVSNFIPNCQGCSFVVTDGSHSCDPASIPVVTPFVDPTEITFNPYTNSTFFNTDSTGSGTVSVSNICTGTGPQDNFERPLLLLDSNGQIAACGILAYVCP